MGKRAQSQALADELIGRSTEPKFNSLFPAKIDLVRGLNFYARNCKHDELKEYALNWAQENCPEHIPKMERAAAPEFMTFGALARLHSRGMPLSDEHFDKMIDHFGSLQPKKAVQLDDEGNPIEVTIKKTKKTAPPKINTTFGCMEEYFDAACNGENYTFVADTSDDLKEVSEKAKELLGDILEFPEDFHESTIKQLKAACKDVIEKCGKAAEIKKTRKVEVTQRKPRKVNPNKVVSKVKYQKEETSIKQKSMSPIDLLGKKKVYIYDTKYKRVIVFTGTEQGFTFKGTTILNVDLAKSFSKRIKTPESVFKVFNGKPGISELNKLFKEIRNKETPMTTGRFSEYFVILNAS